MTELRKIGVLVLSPVGGGEEKTVNVVGVTPRTKAPSLDVQWTLAGIYVLRLSTMRLLAIPHDRVRGRDPVPWVCIQPTTAWRLWWNDTPLLRKDKKRRCPEEFWPKEPAHSWYTTVISHDKVCRWCGVLQEKARGDDGCPRAPGASQPMGGIR